MAWRSRWAAALVLTALAVPGHRPALAASERCEAPVPVYRQGLREGSVCADRAPERGLTVVDLSDDWTPRPLRGTDGMPVKFRDPYVALANGDPAGLDHLEGTGHLASLGVFPSLSLLRRRLEDGARIRCHARVNDAALEPLTNAPEPREPSSEAVRAAEAHLRCDGLIDTPDDRFDSATAGALRAFQMRHMLLPSAELDGPTARRLTTGFPELVFREALRTLRERVVDATGLIEDGSARNELYRVLGRPLDAAALRPVARPRPMPNGAPDRIGRATEAAARALGWTTPEELRGWLHLVDGAHGRVALPLPSAPDHYGPETRLSVEIERGDVWYAFPWTESGEPREQPVERRPTLILYAHAGDMRIPLLRWVTTIGGWRREQSGERIVMRYHASPTGRFVWRDVIAAPRWLPPRGIPDDQLVHMHPRRGWSLEEATVGPGPRAAFGLLMVVHHRERARGRLVDEGMRTHGSGHVASIVDGTIYSHGCHRVLPHLALRLGGFLLTHRAHQARGYEPVQYDRDVRAHGRRWQLRFGERGYRYELRDPIPVRVTRGRIRGPVRREPTDPRPLPPGIEPPD